MYEQIKYVLEDVPAYLETRLRPKDWYHVGLDGVFTSLGHNTKLYTIPNADKYSVGKL